MFDERPFSLNPTNFFAMAADCPRLKKGNFPTLRDYPLPDTTSLCDEYTFAQAAMGWNEDGLGFFFNMDQAFTKATFPDVTRGDSIELFIDTRDLKSAGFNTRFCHHFYFLPEAVEGNQYGEITRFRTEDRHEYCDPQLLQVEVEKRRSSYTMKIFIPTQCLYGYDPKQFDRLGFTYRINRASGKPQHFSIVTEEYQIDQHPAYWASLTLI